MKTCLDEKSLLSLHDGEGARADRSHLESCLDCARRYRRLTDDLKEIVAALKQPAPPAARRNPLAYSGLQWSLAAGIVAIAFLFGRMTTAGTRRTGSIAAAPQSSEQLASSQPPALGDSAASAAASYGLYIDSLFEQQEEPDQNLVATEDTWDTDSYGL
ncbi:MAG TPA: hypothetical protein VJX23_07995 [Candidatus Binataceae bacterium]|nr:hypothetical protein [Candidatus Binataceae bacterium]